MTLAARSAEAIPVPRIGGRPGPGSRPWSCRKGRVVNSFFRSAASFRPPRQVLGRVRVILYFDAQGDAGLTRGVALTAAGLVL